MILQPAQVRPLLRELNMADPVSVTAMPGGSSPSFRIDLADGQRLVLKAYLDAARWREGKERFAAAQLATLDIPVTRYLLIDDGLTKLPFKFAVTTYLPGVAVGTLKGHPDILNAYRQMGVLLRKLHSVRMDGYGDFGAHGIVNPARTNTDYMRPFIASAFERFRHFGGPPNLTDRLEAIVAERFDAVVLHSAGAVFAHDDLHPGNVLAMEQPDGTLALSGLIDFGNARAADAVSDLAKCLFCAGHEAPLCQAPILEGYGHIAHPDANGALWYYTLLHRVVMWWWLRHVGALPAADTPLALIDDLRTMAEAA